MPKGITLATRRIATHRLAPLGSASHGHHRMEVVSMNTRKTIPGGKTPAVVLEDPKYPRNVGYVLRSAFNYGIRQIWITGDRVPLQASESYRLPREERFKEYRVVDLRAHDRPLNHYASNVPVIGVELVAGAMPITYFEHPENAVYVFGAEDGGISKAMRVRCHQFIFLPTISCLNLAMAVTATLSDRLQKAQLAGTIPVASLEETLGRYKSSKEREYLDAVDPI
jgi:tRNA(Leu) C34 or U34 (ribose-2'-O)-methylase TrmL